jgi:hypothetical protein
MKRSLARPAQRGAVLVESIVGIAFSTLCFLGAVYFREVYVAKTRVQRLARASAMAHAMNACSGDIAAGLEDDLPKNSPSPPTNDDKPGDQKVDPQTPPGKAQESLDAFGQSKAGTPFDRITVVRLTTTASGTTKADPASKEQGFRSTVSASSFVTCGDPVSDGGFVQVFPGIGRVFESFF